MPLSELIDHYRDYQDSPFGSDVQTYRYAETCALLVNGLYKLKTPVTIDDFMPNPKPAIEQTTEQQISILRGFA